MRISQLPYLLKDSVRSHFVTDLIRIMLWKRAQFYLHHRILDLKPFRIKILQWPLLLRVEHPSLCSNANAFITLCLVLIHKGEFGPLELKLENTLSWYLELLLKCFLGW